MVLSLLDWGNETVTVYPAEETTDSDGNPIVQPASTGITVQARVQPITTGETREHGYNTMEQYRLKIARGQDPVLGIGTRVEWNGKTWYLRGLPRKHTGSSRTRRLDYVIQRA